ncbi:MAG: CapA family protein, partial [Myxococcales bacterium]|nr:CapA family protein [Myxococcales bacterium]
LLLAVALAEPVRIVAVGDVLPHRRVKASAATFGWDASFAPVVDTIRGADIAFANLESPIAPDHTQGVHGEVFDAPASLATGLAAAGFDVLSMANNHVWDQGVAGMLETRERVVAAGMTPVGVGTTCAGAAAPAVVTVRGVRVAFVALVDLLNQDLRAGPEAPCVFVPGPLCAADCLPDRDALFFRADPDVLTAVVRSARSVADVVVVSAHWGDEYRTVPLPEYTAMARTLVAAGADLVLGHHPHVLQPVERVEAGGRTGVVAYSLGNFLSDMGRTFDPATHPARKGNTRDGAILVVDVEVGPTGPVLTPSVVPTWTRHTALPEGERIDVVPATERLEHVRATLGPTAPFR